MADVIRGLDPQRVAANLQAVRAEIAEVGRDPAVVEILAAVKYVAAEELAVLAEAGVTLVGENRAQELEHKLAMPGADALTWDFIGQLQSRKVKQIVPHVRLIHAVASDSVVRELGKHAPAGFKVLVAVNVSGEKGKSGVAPAQLGDFIARCREEGGVDVVGLMTMPPLAPDPEDNRPWFAALADLAADHGLRELSMGTTQDFAVAAREGATIVRIGTRLYR
jgi:pyridoxal phosphate enzyme (YggS family)